MSNNQGSFVSGLTIGFFAGAAGYFLFGTDKGKKIVKDLEKEWQAARAADPQLTEAIAGEANQEIKASTILRTVKNLIQQIAEQQDEGSKNRKQSTRGKKPVSKKSDTKFKGI